MDPETNGTAAPAGETSAGVAPRLGPVAYMAGNSVAANLLMAFLLVAGFVAYGQIVQEVFPEYSLDAIQVSVEYPGATPEEVEEAIMEKIEEAVASVEGISEVTGTAAEGVGTISAQLQLGTDVARALNDIKSEVDQIQSFPDEAEEPDVRELTTRQSVIKIALYGEVSERALKELAYRVRDDLSVLGDVSYVDVSGVRDYEVSIEVPQAAIRSYGLSLTDISETVSASSLDLPAGSIETSAEEVRVRTLGQNYTQRDYENIVLISRSDGTTIRLGDVATVHDGFEDADLMTRYNGSPAAFVEVFRTSDERVLDVAEAVHRYLAEDLALALPAGIEYAVWSDDSVNLEDRLGLLLKNAALGLLLVLVALTLFLNLRLAFWTAVGIGVSFIGTVALMYVVGVSINMFSLFGFIIAIGIVVDDAIVVGENVHAERERGAGPLASARRGVSRVTMPVVFAVLTTVAAFSPLLAIGGTIGKLLADIPMVVILVLALSLVESLLILPSHLSHLPPPGKRSQHPMGRFFERLQGGVDHRLSQFVNGPLDRGLRFATDMPVVVVTIGVGLLVLAVALIPAGILRVEFFPAIEGDVVTASLEMPVGTPVAETQAVAERIEAAGREAAAAIGAGRGEADRREGAASYVEAIYTVVGEEASRTTPTGGGASQAASNLAAIQFKLVPGAERDVSAERFEEVWRSALGPVPTARALSFASEIVSAGDPVSVELAHPDPAVLEITSSHVMDELAKYAGVFDIQSDQDAGLREVRLRLKPAARTLGLTLRDVASQVRAAFFGDEALRIQRGQEDVRVYVRLPPGERDAISDVEGYQIRVPGGEVALREMAEVSFGEAPSVIQRQDGRRVVTVTADVSPGVVTGQEITERMENEILPRLEQDYPQLLYSFGGEQEEQAESFDSLGMGFALALLAIFALLAIPFRSYVQPLVIMSAIPFGIIGALAGHLLMGLSVGILSLFGIIGLSGVVVNNSLVMIDFINEERRTGAAMRTAIIDGAKSRFRPILLTSLTTFLGVAPLVAETSLQAQILIPMAASIGFGIVCATVILMLIVPALALIQYQAEVWFKKRVMGLDDHEIEVVHHSQDRGAEPEASRAPSRR